MFTKGRHVIRRAWTATAQSVFCVRKESTQPCQTVCSRYGNHRHSNSIFLHPTPCKPDGGLPRLDFARHTYSVQAGRHHQRSVHIRNDKPTRVTVFLRSLSSESDTGDKSSDRLHLNEEDSVEDAVKELDAQGAVPRKHRKGKSSTNNSLKDTMKNVGRMVPDKIVNLLDEHGESLGHLHRVEAIKQSQETGLKLVLVNPMGQPYPTYRLLTGQQLHQEQMLLREKLKAKSAPTHFKEARLSGNIATHDLEVKRRQIHDWFGAGGAQVNVRVTVMGAGKRQKKVTKEQQMEVINQLMSGLEDRVTFVSKPRDMGKDGMNLFVILRPMSAKEKAALVKQKNMAEEGLKQQGGATSSRQEEGGDGQDRNDGRDEKIEG